MIINNPKKRDQRKTQGQIMLEFTFSMIIAIIMIFSTMMIFRWAGYDYGWRRVDHDQRLMNAVIEDFNVVCLATTTNWKWIWQLGLLVRVPYTVCTQWDVLDEGPIEQIDPYFHKPLKMNATWGGPY